MLLVVNGVSKLYGMTGFRIGWVVASRNMVEVMTNVQGQTTSCTSIILQAAAESGVAMEINAHPSRLDLDDAYARRAKELGVLISINTDAHSEGDLDMLPYGVAVARRAGLTKDDVINTWLTKKLLGWLKKRG